MGEERSAGPALGPSRGTAIAAAALALAAAAGFPAAAGATSPRVHYMLHCRGCHLADGTGTPGRVPALAGSMGRLVAVPGGRAFLVRIPGIAQSPLGDAELAELLNWVLPEFSRDELPRAFEPFTAQEVATARRRPLADVERARRELLRDVAASP